MTGFSPEVKLVTKSTVRILIVYHSPNGTTKLVAENVLKGAQMVEGVEVSLLNAEEASAHVEQLADYDAFIWGCPTLFGSLSAGLKSFFEKTGGQFVGRALQNKLASGFTTSGSPAGDKQGVLIDLFTYSTQQGLIWVPLGVPPTNNKKEINNEALNRFGYFSGLSTQSYMDGESGFNPGQADLETAIFFGQRFAGVALQYYK